MGQFWKIDFLPKISLQKLQKWLNFGAGPKFLNALYDSIEELKCIKHPTNCNTAAFNPTKPHVACGGGQEAMDVTTTAASQGYFECFIYNMITEDKVAMFKGHFGPINHLAFSPDGSQICTGGEEGYIRLNHLDPSYTNYRDIDLELGTPGQLVSAL